jgi:hypothetical protein
MEMKDELRIFRVKVVEDGKYAKNQKENPYQTPLSQ